jgi:predicted SprT family Zn-dependent metalloprotease
MIDPGPTAPALTADLEAALLRELRANFDWENHARFHRRLTPPVIVLSDAATRLGRWIHATRTLELARPLVLTRPWSEVVSVLAHEMAHQYVDEVLHVVGETAHGDSFQKVCAAVGIDARAAGAPVRPRASRARGCSIASASSWRWRPAPTSTRPRSRCGGPTS